MTLIVVADDAIERLAEHVSGEALVVMDSNTREVAGRRVVKALQQASAPHSECVFLTGDVLLAGMAEVERVRASLEPEMVAIAVGSGVITDIVRFAGHLSELNFVSVPTAASMDGYASSVAALQIEGVKVTYPARSPAAIFADPRVVAAAPPELTRAGIGDLLAKATARVDWLAAHLLYRESYSASVADRMLGPMSISASHAAELVSGDAQAIRALIGGLIESGIAMALAGSSRPASGCEHHASHFFDLQAARGRRAHASHGLQVGYATRFAMRLQRYAYGGGVASLREPSFPADPLGAEAEEWLGESEEIVTAVKDKRQFVARGMTGEWDAVQRAIAPELQRFDAVERALDVAGIPVEPGYLGIDEEMLRAAFRYGSRLRARYTVIDFLEGQGVLDEAIERMLP